MSQVVIENPIINSPFDEPTRHFRFSDEGITNEIEDGRRTSLYFIPIAKPKKKGSSQLHFDTEWTQERIEENKLVNDIRRRVTLWRKGGYVGVTPTTARLIAYWTDPNRETKLFFCRNEALETAIYIAEVAKKTGMPESITRFERPTTPRTPACRARRSRWPPAPARPSSWPCSLPGTRSTALFLAQKLGKLDKETISSAILNATGTLAKLSEDEKKLAASRQDIARPIVITREAYDALRHTFSGVSDEHMLQLFLRFVIR